jgi:amidohydrolase
MNTTRDIHKVINEIYPDVVEMRRHLHAYPELSFHEFQTADFVENLLLAMGLSPQRVSTTGLVVVIEPADSGYASRCVALRADLDALPITEQTNLDYSSTREGVMHACGHDVHTSVLLGVARLISANRDQLRCRVKLIFQPGEEKLPGGASLLIEQGVLENPRVDEIYGLHVFPEMETGKVGFRAGMYMASCDEIYITIHGKGGHGAMPHQVIDPVLIGSHLVVQLQQIVSRACDPKIPSVLSFGFFQALGATNVIPDTAELKGTFRTMDETWRAQAHELIQKQAELLCQSMGAKVEVRIDKGYPYLENNPELTHRTRNLAAELFGTTQVEDLPIRLTAEDFSYYSQVVPACFFRLGTRNESIGAVYGVHHSKFMVDEEAMKTGMALFYKIVTTERI